MFPPSRIICLTEETVETFYLLGEQDRIVGISGYVVRPPQARREKPRVNAFTSANVGKETHADCAWCTKQFNRKFLARQNAVARFGDHTFQDVASVGSDPAGFLAGAGLPAAVVGSLLQSAGEKGYESTSFALWLRSQRDRQPAALAEVHTRPSRKADPALTPFYVV
jgi:hypothetical protein